MWWKMSIEMTRDEIIHYGLKIFKEIEANEICRVCISSGNSCCFGCDFIQDKVGCQKKILHVSLGYVGCNNIILREIQLLRKL
jgi:hypothetical protein